MFLLILLLLFVSIMYELSRRHIAEVVHAGVEHSLRKLGVCRGWTEQHRGSPWCRRRWLSRRDSVCLAVYSVRLQRIQLEREKEKVWDLFTQPDTICFRWWLCLRTGEQNCERMITLYVRYWLRNTGNIILYVKQTKKMKKATNERKFLIIHVAWWCCIHVAVIPAFVQYFLLNNHIYKYLENWISYILILLWLSTTLWTELFAKRLWLFDL